MSVCTRPMVAAKNAVAHPTMATASMAVSECANKMCDRATTYTPAVTIVAAWINALTGVGSRLLQEIESDQQVARKSHAFPAYKKQNVIRRQDQDQHEKHEQVEVGKKAVVAAFVGHVAGRVNVNEPTHSGHHQHHYD